jgi:hypothetical protein
LGRWTIQVCKLDRDSLITLYAKHVRERVMPAVTCVGSALRGREPKVLWTAVETAKRSLLRPSSRFVGLSHDALQHFVPDEDLVPFGQCWRRP